MGPQSQPHPWASSGVHSLQGAPLSVTPPSLCAHNACRAPDSPGLAPGMAAAWGNGDAPSAQLPWGLG